MEGKATILQNHPRTNISCCSFCNTQSPSDIIKWLTNNVWINRSPLQTNMSLCIGSIHWLQFTTQLVPAAAVYRDWNGPNLSCRGQVVCPALWRHICNSFMKLSRESVSRSWSCPGLMVLLPAMWWATLLLWSVDRWLVCGSSYFLSIKERVKSLTS